MTMINIQYVKCANCGHKQQERVVLSTYSCGECDLDMRPAPMARNVFYIQRCEKCNYVNYSIDRLIDGFEASMLLSPKYVELAKQYFEIGNRKIYSDYNNYLMLAQLNSNCKNYRSAGTAFLHAAWRFDDVKFLEHERKAKEARENAYKCYKKSLEAKHDDTIALICVDLLRRTYEFSKAIEEAKQLIDTVKEENLKKILKFQISLCENENAERHNLSEISE